MPQIILSKIKMEYESIKNTLKDRYDDNKCKASDITDEFGLPFDFHFNCDNGIYKPTLTSDESFILGGCIDQFVENAMKSLLKTGDLFKISEGDFNRSIWEKKTPKIEVGLKTQGGNYIASVSDNGPGIDPYDFQKIWDRGFSRFGTSGRGLDIIKKRIKKYNWSVATESEQDKLTKFSVYIPIKE